MNTDEIISQMKTFAEAIGFILKLKTIYTQIFGKKALSKRKRKKAKLVAIKGQIIKK